MSNIDLTVPIEGEPTTASVRSNFKIAHDEITALQSAEAAAGTVTLISTGSGLTGGPINTAGTIALSTRSAGTLMGNPGTASAVPLDVTVGSGLALSTAGTLSATAGAGGTVTSITAGIGLSGGTITGAGTIALGTRGAATLMGNPAASAAPPSDVTIGGGLSLSVGGVLSATAVGGGTVTSITAGAGLTGGAITAAGTIALANTTVGAGSYTYAGFTVTADGRLTAASSGAAPPGPATIAPLALGSAAIGTSALYARQDHVHPISPQPYDIGVFTPSTLTASQDILRFAAPRSVTLPVSLTGSQATAGTAAAASSTLVIQAAQGANAPNTFTQIGSINFAAAAAKATFTFASQVVLAAGDVLRILAPSTADTALADVNITLAATR